MAGIEEMPGEQPAPAPHLQHEAAPLPNGLQLRQDPRGAGVGVKSEPQMVNQRQIRPVVAHRPNLVTATRVDHRTWPAGMMAADLTDRARRSLTRVWRCNRSKRSWPSTGRW